MRKSCRRSMRYADPSAFLRVVDRQQQLDESQMVDLTLAVRAAAHALRIGAGTEHHVHTLASCINLALVLTERGAGIEFQPAVIAAQEALVHTIERGKRTGQWGFSGPDMKRVDAAVELYEAQLQAIPRRAAIEAVREVTSRMDRGLVFEVAA